MPKVSKFLEFFEKEFNARYINKLVLDSICHNDDKNCTPISMNQTGIQNQNFTPLDSPRSSPDSGQVSSTSTNSANFLSWSVSDSSKQTVSNSIQDSTLDLENFPDISFCDTLQFPLTRSLDSRVKIYKSGIPNLAESNLALDHLKDEASPGPLRSFQFGSLQPTQVLNPWTLEPVEPDSSESEASEEEVTPNLSTNPNQIQFPPNVSGAQSFVPSYNGRVDIEQFFGPLYDPLEDPIFDRPLFSPLHFSAIYDNYLYRGLNWGRKTFHNQIWNPKDPQTDDKSLQYSEQPSWFEPTPIRSHSSPLLNTETFNR